MVGMVMLGLVLSGFLQQSATVALLTLSDHLSSVDFAEYVTNTSYVTRYCTSFNDTNDMDVGTDPDDADPEEDITDFEQEEDDSFAENETSHAGHGRHIVAEPHLKVTES
jgi:NurA-like 5'-3' nuclease